jgi:hypothetical protein
MCELEDQSDCEGRKDIHRIVVLPLDIDNPEPSVIHLGGSTSEQGKSMTRLVTALRRRLAAHRAHRRR